MRATRAAWIAFNTISIICTVAFIGFALAVQIVPDLAVYSLPQSLFTRTLTEANQNEWTRQRGLWKQCIPINQNWYQTTCYLLEPFGSTKSFNSIVQPIINMRIATIVLQIIAMTLVTVTVLTTCTLLIIIWKKPESYKPRAGQYTALGGGITLWILAFIYFISLLLYYETLSEENYLLDSNLLSARSSWNATVRSNSTYHSGVMIPFAWAAVLLLYFASWMQLGASALQQPPQTED